MVTSLLVPPPLSSDGALPSLTEKGSAFSHEMFAADQDDDNRNFSGKLSGTATRMKNTSSNAIAVATPTTRSSLCTCRRGVGCS